MIINNLYSNNFSFCGVTPNWRKRPGQIQTKDLANVTALLEKYNKTHSFMTKMNGPYISEFRKLCANLVAGINAGLIFINLFNDSSRIQVAKLNKKNDNELLTFSYLDENNKPIRKYRIGKDGFVYSPSAEIKKQPSFDFNVVSILLTEFDKLNSVVDNYNYLKKVIRKTGDKSSFLNLAEEMKAGKSNIKTETTSLINTFNNLRSKIHENFQTAFPLKQEFLGETNQKSKSYTFKNVGPDKETYVFTPSCLYKDGRNSTIQVLDKHNNINCIFVLYDNGEVKTAINCKKDADLRTNNLKSVIASSPEEKNIKDIINILIQKMNEFEGFVNSKIQGSNEKPLTKKLEQEKIVNREKTPKPLKTKENPPKQRIKTKKEARITNPVKVKEKTTPKTTRRTEQKFIALPPKNTITNNTPKPIDKSLAKSRNDFLYMNLTEVAQAIYSIFETPIEKRSAHLIHEKLPDGRIFGGRFSFIASDGAKITISQKLSKQIWNYKYYSISIDNGTKNYIINLDYESGRFINSTKEGKILVDNRNFVSSVPKSMMLERNPDIIKLPQYIKELCAFDNTKTKQFIDFNSKNNEKEALIEQEEKEIEEILHRLDKEDEQAL